MYEDAQEIFDYLPIEPGSEYRYIKQLSDCLMIVCMGLRLLPLTIYLVEQKKS